MIFFIVTYKLYKTISNNDDNYIMTTNYLKLFRVSSKNLKFYNNKNLLEYFNDSPGKRLDLPKALRDEKGCEQLVCRKLVVSVKTFKQNRTLEFSNDAGNFFSFQI